MKNSGHTVRQSVWRHALAFVAAYLLVLQAAFAGGAMQRMPSPEFSARTEICLNSGADAPSDRSQRHVAFDCCGLGCLIGSHALEGPASPESGLTYPVERAYEPGATRVPLRPNASKAHGPGLRGPPSAA